MTRAAAPQLAVYRTDTFLADGRQLHYYDEQPGRLPAVDGRHLPARPEPPEFRFDALLGEWVTIAAHRQARTHLPSRNDCPLCPSAPGAPTEIPASDYDVVVFENRFPSLSGTGPAVPGPDAHPADRPLLAHPGSGRAEVVSFTSQHDASCADLPVRRMRTVVEAWADRTAALSATDGIELVSCFENRGEAIGVTLSHPHGQIFGYPFVPPKTGVRLANVLAHRRAHGRDLFAEVLAAELADGRRVVTENADWVAFVPYAARWPFEVHLYPRTHVPDLAELTPGQRDSLAAIYPAVLRRLDAVFDGDVPAILAWHQAPVHRGREEFRLHLQVSCIRRAPGKLKYLAGSETAMGAFVNDISPEHAAALLRAEPHG